MTSILALLCAALLSQVHAAPAANSNPTVTVAQGVVIGTATTLPSATAPVHKFLSIPFAVTPPERFFPPKAHPKWSSPLTAQSTPPACVQQFQYPKSQYDKTRALFNNPGGPPPPESEDCLYVNVYTPQNANTGSNLPVMFWIYGGNLQFGTSGLGYYDGSSFAYNQDIIVVTHNYRTNVFGYSNSPEIPKSQQNAGFFDQRMALQWTHDNIANFGGDPNKITIFGESAGGYSVKQLLAFPPKPLNYRAAIMESEADDFTGNSTQSWESLQKDLGCTTLSCVQKADYRTIRQIVDQKSLSFAPVEDGLTNTNNVRPNFSSGTAAKVPFMIGTNENEGRPFAYILGLDDPGANLTAFLQATFPNNPALQKVLEAMYAGTQSPYLAASEVITESTFLCPASELAALAQSKGYLIWRYLFNATFPNTQTFPEAGVWHSSEIPEVFGTYPGTNAFGSVTQQEIQLSKYMQSAWANFAKNPSKGPGWSEYGTNGNVGDLGGIVADGEKTILASTIDTQCSVYAAYVNAHGL